MQAQKAATIKNIITLSHTDTHSTRSTSHLERVFFFVVVVIFPRERLAVEEIKTEINIFMHALLIIYCNCWGGGIVCL